jgi:3-deoxy-D-manno-octulosonic-acid transferase
VRIMIMFLYHFIWTLILIPLLPILLIVGKGRFAERLALSLPSSPLERDNIWIHALSVGEVISALPLIESLKLNCPGKDIVLTVTTSKGTAVAAAELESKVKTLTTMPVDLWWCIRRIVNYVKPSIFVLVETDVWPGLIDYLSKRGIKSILVNGRISPRTFKSYRRFSFFVRKMFKPFDSCLMQSDLDRERLVSVGIEPNKVITVGNIKYDRDWVAMGQKERRNWSNLLGLQKEDMIWVAGSTHRGEEETLMDVFARLRPSFPALRLIIAPRRIELSGEILRRARSMGLIAVLKTEILKNNGYYHILVVNTLGELDRIYGIAQVSFVGGSLVPNGGHNLLEPASFGCPVLFGPHTFNFVLMSESLVETGGGLRVQDGEELYEAMKVLLENAELRSNMGGLARKFVEKNRGALERVVSHIAVRN